MAIGDELGVAKPLRRTARAGSRVDGGEVFRSLEEGPFLRQPEHETNWKACPARAC